MLALLPPASRPADAPADVFSGDRAFAHVERIADGPHVAGSAANAAVREHLVATLEGLGVRTEVQEAVGMTDALRDAAAVAPVRNVVAVLPGVASTGRVFLVAHYDSVQVGPGGNDDAAGVAAILETVRALCTGPPLRNDVVVLLTDAEEACLCGAEAFVAQHPLAADGGVVLNLEARGSTGPPIMFETSDGNARLAEVFAAAAPHPVATSLAVEVYRRLPNDTDFTPFLAAGFAGLNSAYIDGSATYHTPQDTPANVDRGSLQAHGDNALALVRELGAADLGALAEPGGADATYFPVLGGLARLPGALVWPVAVLAVAAVAVLGVTALRRGAAGGARLAAGAALALVPLVAAPLAATGLWALLVALRPGFAAMLDPWRPAPFRLAVPALVAAVLVAWYGTARRRVGAAALAFGGLVWLAVLGVVLAALAPGGSYLAALPALAGGAFGAVALAVRRPVVTALGAAVAVVVMVPAVLLFLPALGLASAAAPAIIAALLGLAVLPALDGLLTARVVPAAMCLALAGTLTVAGLVANTFDAERPAPAHLLYALDADAGEARWLSKDDPGPWTRQYVSDRADVAAAYPVLHGELTAGPAQAAPLPAPEVTVVADTTAGPERVVDLVLRPQRPVRLLALRVDGAQVLRATVVGREVDPADDGPFGVVVHAPPAGGVPVTLVLAGGDNPTLWVGDGSDGLAGLPGFMPRPPEVGIAGSHSSELVLVSRTVPLPFVQCARRAPDQLRLTLAPASSSLAFAASAASLATPSRIGFGADSTRSLASLRPRPETSSRTTLMTWIFLSPAASRTTLNSSFSSTAGAASPPATAPGAATATGAAAVTSKVSSNFFTNSESSIRVRSLKASSSSSVDSFAMVAFLSGCCRSGGW